MIGLKNLCHFHPVTSKDETNRDLFTLVFLRFACSNFDWFIGLSAAFVIGYSGFFGFGALTSLLQVFVWFGGNMKNYIWTHNGLIVRVMDSDPSGWGSSPGRGHCVVFLVEQDTLLSQCLSPPRCINGYRRI